MPKMTTIQAYAPGVEPRVEPRVEPLVEQQPALPPSLFHRIFNAFFYPQHQEPAPAPLMAVSKFREVFENGQRDEFRLFLSNIFMQLDEDRFFTLMDSILADKFLNDEQIYEELHKRIGEAQFGKIKGLLASLRSLKEIKKDLSEQVKQTMEPGRKINGYAEIGYPGRLVRPLKSKLDMSGPTVVINDKESLADYVQSGFPRPYDTFVALNDCDPLDATKIPNASMDMISCFIGLHHTPPEKLDAFVDSIHRSLRPGGSFILMDHDAKTRKLHTLVDVVHSVFNAATGVSPKEEKDEVRNFQSLDYWTELLRRHGFERMTENPLMRQGDPTLNSVVRFKKIPQGKQEIEQSLLATPGYSRDFLKTYSSSEWHNVRLSKAYASFTKKDHFYSFAYLKEIKSAWEVFANSWKAAHATSSHWQILTSDYALMNLFVTFTQTLEYLFKALISLPMRIISRDDKLEDLEKYFGEVMQKYADFIEHTPFYSFPFFTEIKNTWRVLMSSWSDHIAIYGSFDLLTSKVFLGNFLMAITMTLEFASKGLISAPIRLAFTSDALKEPEETHMLVNAKYIDLSTIDNRIKVIKKFDNSPYSYITVPRYIPCTQILKKMSTAGVETINIEGHKRILVDILLEEGQNTPDVDKKHGDVLFETSDPDDSARKYVAIEVEVEKMHEFLNQMQAKNINVVFAHDF